MRGFLIYMPFLTVIILTACQPSKKENRAIGSDSKSDTLISLENDSSKLTFSLLGGSLVDFEDKTLKINPFSWKDGGKDTSESSNKPHAILQGQYIGFNHWTAPSPGELKLGMPANGEFAYNLWKLESFRKGYGLKMSCEAPLDGFSMIRDVVLAPSSPCFEVTETITNENSSGRPCFVLEHVTLSTPFFDPSMVICSNAAFGFNQLLDGVAPFRFEYQWPMAYIDTLRISNTELSYFSSRFSYLSSHIFQDSIGWVTLYHPGLKLLLGYVWKTSDYPWVHFRNEVNYGMSHVHGISFGTTGLNDRFSYADRLTTTFHGVRSFDFIDAKSSISKKWYCFLVVMPMGYKKTANVTLQGSLLIIQMLTSSGGSDVKLSL